MTPETQKKKLFNSRPLFFSCLPLTAGIILGTELSLPMSYCLIAAGVFLFLYFFLNGKTLKRVMAAFLVLIAGMGMSGASLIKEYPEADLREYHFIRGRIAEKAQKEGYTVYNLSDVTLDGEEIAYRVILSSKNGEYVIGDFIIAHGLLSLPKRAAYPGGYDDYLYCCSKNAAYRFSSYWDTYTHHAKDAASKISALRRNLGEKISLLFSEDPALAKALVIGDETELDPETKDLFSLSGLAHIVSISGSNIFMFFAVFGWAMDRFNIPYRPGLLLQNIFLWTYAAFIGFRVSILRAAVMCQAELLIRFLFKKRDGLTSMAAAYWVLLILNPLQLYDLGFQLTFAAIYGLNVLQDSAGEGSLFSPGNKLKNRLKKIWAPSLAANAALFPVTVNASNYFWAPGLLVNTVASCYSALLIPVLTVLTLLYLIFGKYVLFLGAIGDLLIGGLRLLASSYEILGGIGFYLRDFLPILAAAWYAGIFFVSGRVFLKPRVKAAIALATAAVCLLFCALPLWRLNTAIRIQNSASSHALILYTEEGEAFLLGADRAAGVSRYALDQGVVFQEAYLYEKESGVFKEAAELYSHRRVKTFYAGESVQRVLVNKYGIPAERAGEGRIRVSGRCEIMLLKANPALPSRDFIGACLFIDGLPAALLLSETPEGLPDECRDVKIFYYGEGVSQTFLSGFSCRTVFLNGADEAGMTVYEPEKDLWKAVK